MQGCPFVVQVHKEKNGPDTWDEHCYRIPQEGSDFCPKHTLMVAEEAAEMERKMEKVRRGKEKKALFREMLETSPLALNPKNETGYERS